MTTGNSFDWSGLVRLGLSQLGLKPHELWDLTPVELMIMAGLDVDNHAFLGRSAFERLASLYPDNKIEE